MAKSKPTYVEKLKDPRWQKMRLQILERDDFTCLWCGDFESTLHVHHGYYRSGCDPWEYDPSTLHTLCERCHEYWDAAREETAKQLARETPLGLLLLHDLHAFVSYEYGPIGTMVPGVDNCRDSLMQWFEEERESGVQPYEAVCKTAKLFRDFLDYFLHNGRVQNDIATPSDVAPVACVETNATPEDWL